MDGFAGDGLFGDGPPAGRIPGDGDASLFRRLGIIGMDHLQAVVLAALATQSTMLLIGRPGSAKTWMALRIFQALGLPWRHYNASLLVHEDLVGFLLPDGHGRIRIVRTPCSIWGAAAVLLDEISRCRVEVQNKLFSLIHERRIQGMAIEGLLYAWSCMNPPASDNGVGYGRSTGAGADNTTEDDLCEGSEPLDAALADRYRFVVRVPNWQDLNDRDKQAVIHLDENPPIAEEDAQELKQVIDDIRQGIPLTRTEMSGVFSDYTQLILEQLPQMGVTLTGRRAHILYENIVAVHTARVLGRNPGGNPGVDPRPKPRIDPGESAWIALDNSIPHYAQGLAVDHPRLMKLHTQVWKAVQLPAGDPRRELLLELDPVIRALMALKMSWLPGHELSAWVADGLAEADAGGAHALAHFVIGVPAAGRLSASVGEEVAELHSLVAAAEKPSGSVSRPRARRTWARILQVLANMDDADRETSLLRNLLVGLFTTGRIREPGAVTTVIESWSRVRQLTSTHGDDGKGKAA